MLNESLTAAAPPGTEDTGRSQEACIAGIARGDKEALRALYEQTRSAVYGFALSILKNPQDAEDVLQDTFIKVYTSAHTYRPMGKPMAWVLTITRNLALMKTRQQGKNLNWEDCERVLYESPTFTSDDALVLSTAMRAITGEELQIVVLHAVSGFKHREIARLLELPLSTVLSKYSRALQKLKAKLTQEDSQ